MRFFPCFLVIYVVFSSCNTYPRFEEGLPAVFTYFEEGCGRNSFYFDRDGAFLVSYSPFCDGNDTCTGYWEYVGRNTLLFHLESETPGITDAVEMSIDSMNCFCLEVVSDENRILAGAVVVFDDDHENPLVLDIDGKGCWFGKKPSTLQIYNLNGKYYYEIKDTSTNLLFLTIHLFDVNGCLPVSEKIKIKTYNKLRDVRGNLYIRDE